MNHFRNAGQATIEYILIFSFISLIGVGLARAIGDSISTSAKSLGWVLTQELSTGVCRSQCFFGNYKNGITD
jgi:Flp pilus assembly pilin Flp